MNRLQVVLWLAGIGVLSGCGNMNTSLSMGDPTMGHETPTVGNVDTLPHIGNEDYGKWVENDFIESSKEPTSTLSVDVDTASYSLARRNLQGGMLPQPDSVRVEEFINYFRYNDQSPATEAFAVHLSAAPSHFGPALHLLRVAIKGKEIPEAERKDANLIFLVDVSGSMSAENKLPLVKYALKQLLKNLRPTDTLGIVVYASKEGVLLEPTPVSDTSAILDAIDSLEAGGSTNGEGGIKAAYALAEKAYKKGGVNRVILCTDGDFNVGVTGDELIALIEQYREKGVTLSSLGFGMGNYKDEFMEQLADKGNGNYAFIDGVEEADRVTVKYFLSTIQVIAKDVKIQVVFNPQRVKTYRLIGYENRLLNKEDFKDDTKDAGEIGAGHNVTAFYEVELTQAGAAAAPELATVYVRHKEPDGVTSSEIKQVFPYTAVGGSFEQASADFRFAAAVVEFAEILRHSKHSQGARFEDVLSIATAAAGSDPEREAMTELVQKADALWSQNAVAKE